MVFLGNMAADADGIQSVQASFLAAFAPAVSQYPITAENEDVRDELFVAPVLFGLTSIAIKNVRRRGDDGQVFLYFQAEPLEQAQLFEKFPFKTKHSFFHCHSSFAF